jgi:hypothetical protein
MRRANTSLKAVSLAALAVIALSANAQNVAQPAPLPPESALPASAAASIPAVVRAPTSAAVQAAAVGKPEAAPATQMGTLRELEALQRETALAEARKKLRELAPPPAPVIAAVPPAAVSAAPKQKSSKKDAPAPAQTAAYFAPPTTPVEFVEPPKAKLVNLMVIGARARADVMDGTRMFTIKEGDKLGAWTVARIASDGVVVERHYTETMPGPGATPPEGYGIRPPVAEAFSGAYAFINASHPTYITTEKVETKVLQSATPGDIAVALAGSNTQLAPAGGYAVGSLPPPLPSIGKPDSTSSAAVPPLPPALGGMAVPNSAPALPMPSAVPMTTQPPAN